MICVSVSKPVCLEALEHSSVVVEYTLPVSRDCVRGHVLNEDSLDAEGYDVVEGVDEHTLVVELNLEATFIHTYV